jgi:hypothetical protein
MSKRVVSKKAAIKKGAAKRAPGSGFFAAATRPGVYARTVPPEASVKADGDVATTKQQAIKTSAARRIVRGRFDYQPGLVFVAMAFSKTTSNNVFAAIKDTCKRLKLNARRVDENATSGFVILEIAQLIEQAEFLIFDVTHERPNVYYELGYAHGVGNRPSDILLIAKHGSKLHFDIAALRVRFYKNTEDLRIIVKTSMTAMIRARSRTS